MDQIVSDNSDSMDTLYSRRPKRTQLVSTRKKEPNDGVLMQMTEKG